MRKFRLTDDETAAQVKAARLKNLRIVSTDSGFEVCNVNVVLLKLSKSGIASKIEYEVEVSTEQS